MLQRNPFGRSPGAAWGLYLCALAPVFAEPPAGLLSAVSAERRVIAGKLKAEVENGLVAARRSMRDDPATAEQNLKLMLESLNRSPDIEPELRDPLRRQLQTAIRLARVQKIEQDQRTAEGQAAEAAGSERARLYQATETQQQKLKQIVDRLEALLDEGRYAIAQDELVPEVARLAPDSAIDSAAAYGVALTSAARSNESITRQRHDQFTRALASVESAATPRADEPPITYPTVERWQEITDQRAQYKSVDVHRPGSAEQRILNELNKTTVLDAVEMPLKDLVNYLSDLHRIPIVLATKQLDQAGITPDTPITKTLRGVTLRSALRLALKDLELSYLVQDEVIQITTPDDAASRLATKVYPVGDLVVPVQPAPNMFMPGGLNGMQASGNNMNGPTNPLNPGMPQMNGQRAAFPVPGVF
jgi:hypothetical protein